MISLKSISKAFSGSKIFSGLFSGLQRLNRPNAKPCAVICAPDISIDKLSIRYGDVQALSSTSLSINGGEITALVGPSGCGKSSLLSAMNRLLDEKTCAVSGSIFINKQDILEPQINLRSLRKLVGTVFQKPNPFPMSIAENICFPLREHGLKDRKALNQQVEELLTRVGLWDEVKDRLGESALSLSGGQQQRLCIARALSLSPKILLLDEPCSALDPIATSIIEDLILSLRGQYTVLMVTHHLAQAKRIADHVVVCWVKSEGGYIVESGKTTQIFEFPKNIITEQYLNGRCG